MFTPSLGGRETALFLAWSMLIRGQQPHVLISSQSELQYLKIVFPYSSKVGFEMSLNGTLLIMAKISKWQLKVAASKKCMKLKVW